MLLLLLLLPMVIYSHRYGRRSCLRSEIVAQAHEKSGFVACSAAHPPCSYLSLCVIARRFAVKWRSCFIISFARSLLDMRRGFISRCLSRTRCIAMMLSVYGDVWRRLRGVFSMHTKTLKHLSSASGPSLCEPMLWKHGVVLTRRFMRASTAKWALL